MLRLVSLLSLVAALAPPAALPGQGREPVWIEVPGMDFRPDGAWRKRTAQVRARRAALLASRNYSALNVPRGLAFLQAPGTSAVAVTGDFFVPVVLIDYSDVSSVFTTSDFTQVLFGAVPPDGQAYTLKTYYEELSGHRITMNGRVFSSVTLDTTAAFYEDGCNGVTIPGVTSCPGRVVPRLGLLLTGALDKLSNGAGGDTLWNRFDNDGPDGLPNSGDDDGFVDFVTFLQPKVGGECRQGATGIWAHRWKVSAASNGSPYVTRTPRRNAAGQVIPGQFLRIDDYTIQSQLGGSTSCEPTEIMPVGTVAHETGHAFGLPDLYDTFGSTSGIGEWGLMGSGNFSRPYSPASYDAWSLVELGWATVVPLTTSRTIVTGPRQTSDTVFLAQATNPTEYLLLENRQPVGSDTAQMNPTYAKAKAPGLLLWHVDQARVNARIASNQVNSGLPHGVALKQADGKNDLGKAANRGDRGDPYPGTSANTRFGLTTTPAALDNAVSYLGFIVDSIEQLPGQAIRFRFTRREPSVFKTSTPGAFLRVNGLSWPGYTDVVPAGDQVTLSVDPVQSILGDRTIATFLGWSQGGPATQVFTSGAAKPDTLTALFQAQHRLKVTTSGSGLVTADRAGDLTQGFYVPEGVLVTLTATDAPGLVFNGWVGDTVSSAKVLKLPMGRAFDLVASFVGEVTVTATEAVSELLGAGTLSGAQRVYLDALGNRNGVYDLGDYLALIRRSGQAPSAAVLRMMAQDRKAP